MNDNANHGQGTPAIGAIRFVDLVDVASLQTLMDSFHKVIGLANAIIDLDGVVITHSGWQDLCTRYHRVNPETCRRCIESDTSLAFSMTRGEHYAAYRCLNGLVDTASPIIVAGQHVANIFTGQFFVAPPDLEFFRLQARQFAFDEAEYLAAVARVPVIAEERVEDITGVYAQLAQMLAANGLDRLHQLQAERRLEEANRGLAQRQRELEAANKELENFSYSMSHDLRTPLRAIDGYSKLLLEEHAARLDAEGRRLLKAVGDNGRRMGQLIDDILRFISIGRRQMEFGAVDIAALAREKFAQLQAARGAGSTESTNGPEGQTVPGPRLKIGELPPAWGDHHMLGQVLLNLLSNAIKFSRADTEAVIELSGKAGKKENIYWIRDRGVGFDMRYVDKLFKIFERVHPTGRY
ncbi:MAG: PocR ligand-binding domain-containing protein, partial [Sterolibacterium sp.]